MKFYSDEKIFILHHDLKDVLAGFREKRGFNVEEYVDLKVNKINSYMKNAGLKSCVIAISGGIDSAITYALIHHAKQQSDSPIQKVVPIFLPVYQSEGATNQEKARSQAADLLHAYSDDVLIEINLSDSHILLKNTVDVAVGITGEAWASGQLVSYLRTPTYYYVTSLLNQQGLSPIICGTTNRDEGAYLGYFGKASDGMVDVQLISDIHKSEVYEVARYLGVPKSILSAIPTGDMYDNRHDEEVFGAPYDFVELYLHVLNLSVLDKTKMYHALSVEAKEQYLVLSKNLEDLHAYNKHKYLGASPAVHLDVLDAKVKGGWDYNVH